ncbi:hypothetical protein FPV67DRAFT_1452955 [Lyophyllum atratum]|nr:hypothetical protein FPV67DRAFT_1452955 [Lyophyllum atratum]
MSVSINLSISTLLSAAPPRELCLKAFISVAADISLHVEASENQATRPQCENPAMNSTSRDLGLSLDPAATYNMDDTQTCVEPTPPWQEWFPRVRSNSDATMPSLESIGSDDMYTTNLCQILGARGPVNNEDTAVLALFLEYTHDLDQALHKYGFKICKEAWKWVLMDRMELMEEDDAGDLYQRVIRDRALGNDGSEAEM